jgi:hypothetical protein
MQSCSFKDVPYLAKKERRFENKREKRSRKFYIFDLWRLGFEKNASISM